MTPGSGDAAARPLSMRGWFSFFITRCGLTAYFYTGSDSSGTGLYLVLGFIRFLFIRFLFRAGVLYYTSCRRTYLSEGADLFWPQDSPSVRMQVCLGQYARTHTNIPVCLSDIVRTSRGSARHGPDGASQGGHFQPLCPVLFSGLKPH